MLKERQKIAYAYMVKGYNVFLTGDAGTGKSFAVREYIEWAEDNGLNVLVTAPTGIAALNLGGVTLHRAFKAPIHACIGTKPVITDVLKSTDVVIIDEISMCRVDLFEYVIKCINKASEHRVNSLGKKKIQVIVCGDFFQLPPVLNENDKDILCDYYGTDIGNGFAFQSKLWSQMKFVSIYLDEVVRQSDEKFSTLLNMCRVGDGRCLYYIKSMSSPVRIQNAVTLCATNKKVNDINNSELNKVKSKSFIYKAKITGDVKQSDKPTDDELELKVGARVMTLINHPDDLYNNGSIGTIKKLTEDSATVEFDDGYTATIYENEWEICEYSLNSKKKVKKNVIGTFSQLPLRLAWAITIHKSQGQSYNAVNLQPYCWDAGQLYVALSRAKSVDKLFIDGYLSQKYLVTSKDVQIFYTKLFQK